MVVVVLIVVVVEVVVVMVVVVCGSEDLLLCTTYCLLPLIITFSFTNYIEGNIDKCQCSPSTALYRSTLDRHHSTCTTEVHWFDPCI